MRTAAAARNWICSRVRRGPICCVCAGSLTASWTAQGRDLDGQGRGGDKCRHRRLVRSMRSTSRRQLADGRLDQRSADGRTADLVSVDRRRRVLRETVRSRSASRDDAAGMGSRLTVPDHAISVWTLGPATTRSPRGRPRVHRSSDDVRRRTWTCGGLPSGMASGSSPSRRERRTMLPAGLTVQRHRLTTRLRRGLHPLREVTLALSL